MYGLHGKMVAHAGQRDALVEMLMTGAESLRQFEGCLIYVISIVEDDPNAIWVTEMWQSQAEHQASLTLESVRALITQARPLIAAMPEHMEFTPLGGKGLPEEDE